MAQPVRKQRRHYRMPKSRDHVPDVTVTPIYKGTSEGIVPYTQEEVDRMYANYNSDEENVIDQWHDLRVIRNQRLLQTDWTVCRAVDQGQPVDEDWAIYRQLLRDIPQDFAETPWDIDWPIAPDGTGGDDGEGHMDDDHHGDD